MRLESEKEINMTNYLPLAIVGLIPIIASVLLYIMDRKVFKNVNYVLKQIVYGLIFGGIAIIGTEFGVQVSGVTMNVRDAAPLCAGLFFGWPAAIIAGLVGGIERWFAVYWGAGTVTRLACSLATLISGLLVTAVRINAHSDEATSIKWPFAFGLGAVAEIIHMFLVILTNFNLTGIEAALEVVKSCTIPMTLGVSLSAGISAFIISKIHAKETGISKNKLPDISTNFQKALFIVMAVYLVVTNCFCIYIQRDLADAHSTELLRLNLEDAIKDVDDTINANLAYLSSEVDDDIQEFERTGVEFTTETLKVLAEYNGLSVIDMVGEDNIIYASSFEDNIGFDLSSEEEFEDMVYSYKNNLSNYYVMNYKNSDGVTMKYATYRRENGGYIGVAYDSNGLSQVTTSALYYLAHYRRIGLYGQMIIADKDGLIISDYTSELYGMNISDIGLDLDTENSEPGVRYRDIVQDVDEYYSYQTIDDYIIIVMETVEETYYTETISAYLICFVELLVYAGIFLAIYMLVKRSIVEDVNRINDDLAKITSGNLDTVVDVKDTLEFATLSDHINTTVDKLKQLISEAEQRMQNELKYAAEIQRSSLPINFPEREDIDIYATMTPAKEVGGDFYDFYFLRGNKLCILIADVSGKGVPASLFMMRAKTTIKSYAEYGFEVNDIFTDSNFNLTEGNDAGLFVTSWIGILDLETGHLNYANAGHNPPLIRKPNGEYEYLKGAAGFVLGGMEGVAYKKYEMDIEEGTEIFIYTDGLTESQNINQELYGEDRLKASINKYLGMNSKEICENVEKDIRAFQGEADQFDDMTMLSFRYLKKSK